MKIMAGTDDDFMGEARPARWAKVINRLIKTRLDAHIPSSGLYINLFIPSTPTSPKHQVGYLPQEPQLEAGKTVGEEIEKSVSEIHALLKEYEEVSGKLSAPDMTPEEQDKLSTRMDELQSAIEAKNGWYVRA